MAEYIYGEQVIESQKVGGVTYGTVKPLRERRERVVRCRDCEHGMGGGNLCSMFALCATSCSCEIYAASAQLSPRGCAYLQDNRI